MTWCRLDDTFPEEPRVLEAGPEAAWLHVVALCYSSRHVTDGFVSAAALKALGGAKAKRLAAVLVRVKLWVEEEGGWQIRDYLDTQPSREHVLEVRRQRAAAGRVGGIRSGESREAKAKQDASSALEANGEPHASAPLEPRTPTPPVGVRSASSANAFGSGRATARPSSEPSPGGTQRERADAMVAAASGPWRDALRALSLELPLSSFVVWLGGTRLELHDGVGTVVAPNDFARDKLAEDEYRKRISSALEGVVGRPVDVKVRTAA